MHKKRLRLPESLKGSDIAVPEKVQNFFRPVRAEKSGGAVINLFGTVGSEWSGFTDREVADRIEALKDETEITVNINSPGGDFFTGVAVYNMLVNFSGRVVVRVVGLAGSAASIIAMAGDEIQVSDASMIFVHCTMSPDFGNRFVKAAKIADMTKFDTIIANLYSARTGLDYEDALEMMERENGEGTIMTGAESKEKGFADVLKDFGGEIEEDEDDSPVEAKRAVDLALAKAGYSVAERKTIHASLKEFHKPRAVEQDVTPRADVVSQETKSRLTLLAEALRS